MFRHRASSPASSDASSERQMSGISEPSAKLRVCKLHKAYGANALSQTERRFSYVKV